VAREDALAGMVVLADPLKPDAPAALARLAGAEIAIVVALGDVPATVRAVTAGLPVAAAHGGPSPAGQARADRRPAGSGAVGRHGRGRQQ
jgi:Cu+-exporting ATPase